MKHTPESSVAPIHVVSFPDIFYSPMLGNGGFISVESGQHNVRFIRQDFQPLFIIHTETERKDARNNSAVGDLAVKNNAYSFPSMSASFGAIDSLTLIYKHPFAVVVSYSSSVVNHSQLWACRISIIL